MASSNIDEEEEGPLLDPEALGGDLPFAQREQVWSQSSDAPHSDRALLGMAPEPIREDTLPRLLTACHQARHTGEIRVRRDQVLKVIFLEAGAPTYAASNLAHERFGKFCARKGIFPESDLPAVAALVKEARIRTGEALIRLGLISAEQRTALLLEQIQEIVWSTFRWERGEATFAPHRKLPSDVVKLSVSAGDLILDGVGRTETLVSLRRKLPKERKLFPLPDPPFALHTLNLDGPRAHLVAHTDGTKTVADLLALTDLSERDALATLHGLELIGAVEERAAAPSKRRISYGL